MESIITFLKDFHTPIKIIIMIAGYFITFWLTTLIINKVILKDDDTYDADGDGDHNEKDENIIRDGRIIGKCENVIILSFVLTGEITGLALIFAAKSLARQKDINDNSGFFLAGTMINFTVTLLLAFMLKFVINLLPQYA